MESTNSGNNPISPKKLSARVHDENLHDDIEDKHQSYFDYSAGKNQST